MEHRFRGGTVYRMRKKNFCRCHPHGILHPALPEREANEPKPTNRDRTSEKMEKKVQESETLWQQIMNDLLKHGEEGEYVSGLVSSMRLREDTGSKLIIEYPSDMPFYWVEINYGDRIASAVNRVLKESRELEYVEATCAVIEEQETTLSPAHILSEEQPAIIEQPARRSKTPRSATKIQTQLNADYTFDNYVVGANNQLAFAAAQALVNSNQRIFNPLFIYGQSGMGKTHLMHAIGNALRARQENVRVLYVTSEQFTNAYIEAVRKRGDALEVFRKKYRKVDVLLIDDVQFMARADRTQEEFFHTFNALFESGKQIVLSADCPATRITGMDDRLKTRFSQGMTVELTAPCYEMRMAILRQKMQSWKTNMLSNEVVEFLARNITQSVRALEGALVRTSTIASLNNTCPSIAFLRDNLADLMTRQPVGSGVSIADIKQRVANEFGIRVEDIDSRRRLASLAHPRQVAMFLARKHTNASLQDIGAAFGRDHSTVLHALRNVESKLETDAPLRSMVEQFAEALA